MNKFWWESRGDVSKGIKWMSWEKVCVHKELGGRGFRDLHLFNIALLGKMVWWLVHDTASLVRRVLKFKYFPHLLFLEAPKGANPSYTWLSLVYILARILSMPWLDGKLGGEIRLEFGVFLSSSQWMESCETAPVSSWREFSEPKFQDGSRMLSIARPGDGDVKNQRRCCFFGRL